VADRFRYEDTGPGVRQRRRAKARREQQFRRLRARIEERAARKFSDVELEGDPPGVILRAIDFRVPVKKEGRWCELLYRNRQWVWDQTF